MGNAPLTFETTIDLPAPPEKVFWTLLDPEKVPTYDRSFEYWRPEEFPPKVGTQNHFKVRFGPLSMKGTSRFRAFDPPHGMTVESVKPSWPFSIRSHWELVPAGGGTRFTYSWEVDAPTGLGWMANLLAGLYWRRIGRETPGLSVLFADDREESGSVG